MDKTKVILVDNNDNETGFMGKIEAHKKALLHRAISVFICNTRGEWLLHRRALDKYHSGGLWTNATCTHPYPGESYTNAANRRLNEEMGMSCELTELFSFVYMEILDNELTEHEYDHVFLGISDQIPSVDTKEVIEWKYIKYDNLYEDVQLNPDLYTSWFRKIFENVYSHLITKKLVSV